MLINTHILNEVYQTLSIKLLTNIRIRLQFCNAKIILHSPKLGHSLKIYTQILAFQISGLTAMLIFTLNIADNGFAYAHPQ